MALDLLAVASAIATLSVVYDHAIRLWSVARSLLTDADTAGIVTALTDAYCAKNTFRAYLAGWKRWQAWACDQGVRAMPADPASVAAYLSERGESGKSPATVRQDRAAIGAAHRAVEAVDPTADEAVRRVLRSIGTTHCDRGRGQVQGLNWEGVDRTVALAASAGSLAGIRDAALLRLGSDALLRVSLHDPLLGVLQADPANISLSRRARLHAPDGDRRLCVGRRLAAEDFLIPAPLRRAVEHDQVA